MSPARACRVAVAVAGCGALLAGCGKLQGFGGPVPPLVTFNVAFTGDLPGQTGTPSLNVALIWGDQWLTEPFCIVPAESDTLPGQQVDAVQAVIDDGCRDPFGFVPLRVAATAPLMPDGTASVSLFDLPGADVMIGDPTSRVAYASLVIYDERSGNDTLDLSQPHRTSSGGDERFRDDTVDSTDVVYGASFLTMTQPDQRVAYVEGQLTETAFYPRSGCDLPQAGFSVLAAGGFSYNDGLASAVTGVLPPEAPGGCMRSHTPDLQPVTINARAPDEVREVSCIERTADGSVRYREPPTDAPDFTDRKTVCALLPPFDTGGQSTLIQQLVVTGRVTGPSPDRCKGLTHYTLRGCRENVVCPVPDWDFTANPPAWWTCL